MERRFCPYCMSRNRPGEPCPSCGLTEGAYAPLSHHLPPGTIVAGRYLVGRVLGEGGFGITYIGCDLRLELKVAIKEFFPGDKVTRNNTASLAVSSYTGAVGRGYEASRARFIKEARAMARMDKTPQIVAVRDFFEENNTAYIVMEYVDGTTFKELVTQKGGKFLSGELLPLVEPLFRALSAMHRLGLIHRDISPDNLMLENGCVRLLDFGCAREADKGNATMTIVLKHGYSPIEQYQHKGQGPWTDVYSLAATLYFCLTGTTPPQALDRICDEELIPPRQLGADLTPAQERAILRGMGVRRSQRYSSVEEFRSALFEGVGTEDAAPADMSKTEDILITEEIPVTENSPITGDIPITGESPVTGDAQDTQQKPDKPAPTKKLLWPVVGGVAAALCLGLLVWRPWAGPADSTDPGQTPSETAGPADAAPPSQTSAPAQTDAPGTGYALLAEDEQSLRDSLADGGGDSVTVPSGAWITLDEAVTLTKRLRIEKDAGVNFSGGVTVAAGGRLEVAGSLDAPVLLRTAGGGAVSVEDSGRLYSPMVWLAREDDLFCAENGTVDVWGSSDPTKGPIDGYARSHYWVFDEADLFAGAVHVTTEEQFAQNCQGAAPLVIDRDLTLTRQYWPTVSIRVPEGITLDAPCPDPGRDKDNCTLSMQNGAILVNHGTVTGRVAFDGVQRGENGQQMGENPCMLANFGTMDANLLGEMGAVINLGTMTAREILRQTALHNLGSLTFDGLMEAQGNWWQLAGTTTVARGAELVVYGSTGINTFGEAVAEGRLRNEGQFHLRSGGLTVKNAGGLVNGGVLEVVQDALLRAEAGAQLQNSGVMLESGRVTLGGGAFDGPGRLIRLDYGDERTRHVGSESELRAALADDRCDLVVWSGQDPRRKINLNGGPIELTKGLILLGSSGGTPVDFNTGGLTLSGENAFFMGSNVDFHSNAVTVQGGAVVLDGDTCGLGNVAADGGMVCFEGGCQTPEGIQIDLRSGGALAIVSGICLDNCTVDVGRDSVLRNFGGLELDNCTVTNGGKIESSFGYLNQQGGSLVNSGDLLAAGWENTVHLGGDVSNHGQIYFGGQHLVTGTLVNESVITLEWQDTPLRVAGRLVNNGVIRCARGTYIETVDGGSFTGNPVVYGE